MVAGIAVLRVLVRVELDGQAIGNSVVTQARAAMAQQRALIVLDDKGETFTARRALTADLKIKFGLEPIQEKAFGIEPRPAELVGGRGSQAEAIANNTGITLKYQPGWRAGVRIIHRFALALTAGDCENGQPNRADPQGHCVFIPGGAHPP